MTWPWPRIESHDIPSCSTHWPLVTYKTHSNQKNFVDGQTDAPTDRDRRRLSWLSGGVQLTSREHYSQVDHGANVKQMADNFIIRRTHAPCRTRTMVAGFRTLHSGVGTLHPALQSGCLELASSAAELHSRLTPHCSDGSVSIVRRFDNPKVQ